MKNFEVMCDNKGSFQIAARSGPDFRSVHAKPAILVRCDRTDYEDNARGLKLANLICDLLNSLPTADAKAMLRDDMIPVNFGN